MKSIVTFTEIILFNSVQHKGQGDHRRAQNLYSGNYGPVSASLETPLSWVDPAEQSELICVKHVSECADVQSALISSDLLHYVHKKVFKISFYSHL